MKFENLTKTCKIHGVLDESDIYACANKAYKLGYYTKCKLCQREKQWVRKISCKKHGELNEGNVTKQGRCKQCHRETASTKRNNNREWFNKRIAEDKLKNPEKWKLRQEKLNTYEILRVKGFSHIEYEKLVKEQNNKCKICNEAETRAGRKEGTTMRLILDHCHTTNKVRGLLCHQCNVLIGFAKDSTDILESAIIYLQAHKMDYEKSQSTLEGG